MKCLLKTSITFFLFNLYHLLDVEAFTQTQSCLNISSFTHSLNGSQCFGLVQVDGISNYSDCETTCCSISTCQMFEYCSSSNPACGSFSGTCWIGQADLSKCVPSNEWLGASRALPPPPPRLPQQYLRPYTQSPTLPLAVLDLADETKGNSTWSIQIDDGPTRAVYVPSGGYNSDQQELPFIDSIAVNIAANYTREFTVPLNFGGDENVVILHLAFGAVNHGAEVYIAPANATNNVTLVGAHYGPNMAFDVDASAAGVVPGGSYLLTVISRPLPFFNGDVASGFRYAETWSNPSDGWSSRQCAGICKYVRLVALPRLRIDDLVVRSNVTLAIANVDVVIRNDGAIDVEEGDAVLTSLSLSSWNAIFGLGSHTTGWPYPTIEPVPLPRIAAGTEVSSTFSIDWSSLPPSSFWWPNRPFNESYYSQLHILNATLDLQGVPVSFASKRFGFVEHKESSSFFYSINGVRINFLSDATPENGMSYYDCYANEGAFGSQGGARETWRRYMRLGLTANRIHQSTPTQEMLNAADEVGFLLKPETPIRGCPGYEPCNSSSPLLRQSVNELILWSRSHPSVFAFSLENEGSDNELNEDLVDAAILTGVNVPLTTEGSGESSVFVGPKTGGHAVNLLHYAIPQEGYRGFPPRGVGECAWCVKDGIEEFSSLALAGRLDDVAYYSGWDMLNYWPNFLQGMNASLHAWHQEPCNGTDRVDGIDGWNSPLIEWIQAAFNPFLVADVGTITANPTFTPEWPRNVDNYKFITSGNSGNITRKVALFNDILADSYEPWTEASSLLSLLWSAQWEDPKNPSIASGSILDIPIAPGFHSVVDISLPIPDPGPTGITTTGGRKLFFSFSSFSGGDVTNPYVYYCENRTFVLISKI
jgi:hypothetical protein